jgi:hypothetical protein
MSIDDRAIDRILAAVGRKFVSTDLDRPAMRDAIEKAWATKRKIDEYRPGPRARECSKQLAGIYEAAAALLSLLTTDNDASEWVTKIYPEAALSVRRLVVVVDSIKGKLDESAKETTANYARVPTAAEWFAGVELPCIYQECFDRKAAVSRNAGKPDGPCVRFVKAVLAEMKLPFADESIARAMTRFAELRERRRLVRQRERDIGQK